MKNKFIRSIVAIVMALAMLSGSAVGFSAQESEPEDTRMAYNIYSNPQFGTIPNAFETFSIDMYVTKSAPNTYWSLANFNMHISEETREMYNQIEAGGAYAGMQTKAPGADRTAILSFWEWHYWPNGSKPSSPIGTNPDGTKNWGETNLTAERIYPAGTQSDFGGEGEGTNWITPYDWHDNQWYRMVLHTWDDPIRGTTYCGQWIADLTTGQWKLISYFDTKMKNSYLEGAMSFFMENFSHTTADMERDVRLKNIYVKQYENKQWTSVNSTQLRHCNNWANNKKGKHTFGATEEYFWGQSGGPLDPGVSQAEHDAAWKSQVYTINQPETPTFGEPSIKQITIAKADEGWCIGWESGQTGTPQLTYELTVLDAEGKTLYTESATRPEAVSTIVNGLDTDTFKCRLTVTDIFGKTVTAEAYSDKYDAEKVTDIGFAGHQEGANAIRFVGYTDNLNYESIDLRISVLNVAGKHFSYPVTTVYKTLSGNVDGELKPVVSCDPTVECGWNIKHDYLYGYAVEKIPAGTYQFSILPVATTIDGKTVYGEEVTREITVEDPSLDDMLEDLTEYKTFGWFNANVVDTVYNIQKLTSATEAPFEVWENHLQMLIRLDKSEFDATKGYGSTEYDCYFDLYYKPQGESEYKCVTLQPWSIYSDDKPIYRCTFYSAGMDDMVLNTKYDCVFVFRNGQTRVGYAKSTFTWTDSADCYLAYAMAHDEVIK